MSFGLRVGSRWPIRLTGTIPRACLASAPPPTNRKDDGRSSGSAPRLAVPVPRPGKQARRRIPPSATEPRNQPMSPPTADSKLTTGHCNIVAAYCLGGELPLDAVKSLLLLERSAVHLTPGKHRSNSDVLHFHNSSAGSFNHAFFFNSGPTVYWGFSPANRKAIEKLLQTVRGGHMTVSSTLSPLSMKEFDHDFIYESKLGNSLEKSDFRDDKITLRGESQLNTDELLAISYGLAQSVQLMVYEEVIDRLVDQTAALPTELASRGLISMKPRDIKRRIGELLSARYAVNLLTDILDTPEFFWDHPELSSLYAKCTSEVDLGRRAVILDKRMTIIKDMLDVLNEELASGSSSRVERAILLLIAIEVALEIGVRLV